MFTTWGRRFTFGSSQRRQDILTAYLCLLPWIIGFLAFVVGPMLFSLGLSFYESDLLTTNYFVGLKNYQELFQEANFWQSLKVTFIYAFTTVPLGTVIALAIATLLNQRLMGLGLWRTIYYLPTVISGVAVSLLWLQIFNPRAGLVNNLLSLFGVQGPNWLYDSNWALSALIAMSVWGVGANMPVR
jgi:multiple sugar transport system permease protein